jgi:hypothetical protein
MAVHSSNVNIDLPAGTHEAIVRLDAGKLPDFIRLQSADVTFLTN